MVRISIIKQWFGDFFRELSATHFPPTVKSKFIYSSIIIVSNRIWHFIVSCKYAAELYILQLILSKCKESCTTSLTARRAIDKSRTTLFTARSYRQIVHGIAYYSDSYRQMKWNSNISYYVHQHDWCQYRN